MGQNNQGQLGDGTTNDRLTPVKIREGVVASASGLGMNLIILADGSLETFGLGHNGVLGDGINLYQSSPIEIVSSGVSEIASGQSETCFKRRRKPLGNGCESGWPVRRWYQDW